MKNYTYHVIGLMSGTSLDGLDIAHCTFFKKEQGWDYQINGVQSISYPQSWRDLLEQAVHTSTLKLLELDLKLGTLFGEATLQFMEHNKNLRVDAIASHGHTIFHQPDKRITHQIGNAQEIAIITNTQVIADFRSQDVLLGGQGAPLVPIGDRDLLGEYDFCLNLGGIANISFQHAGQRVAYDIGPANMLLNYLIGKVGKSYDAEGRLAASGSVDNHLLAQLNALPYYQLPFPKSTGFEWFAEEIVPIIERAEIPIEDMLCTAVHHEAEQIAKEVLKYRPDKTAKMLVTGGGAKNSFLIEVLQDKCGKDVEVHLPNVTMIDFKEAMVFAFMGAKRLAGEMNCLSSVTGAVKDTTAGVIYFP